MCTYKPLLSTIFTGIYKGQGRMNWPEVKPGRRKILLLFSKLRLPTEGEGKLSWGKTAWVSQKMPGERQEGSCSSRAGASSTWQAKLSAETWEHLPCASRATGRRACCSFSWASLVPWSFSNRATFPQTLHSFLLLLSISRLLPTFLTNLSPQLKTQILAPLPSHL